MSGTTSQPYAIPRAAGRCAATGRELTPGEPYIAALAERAEDDALDRLDYSAQAWDEGARPPRLFAFWRAVVSEPDARPKVFIDDDALLALFEQLGEAEDERRIAFRFVLALILIRKRLLRHEGGRRENGVSFMIVRMRGPQGWKEDAPIFEVVDPQMTRDMIADVTEQLGLALRGEA